MKNTNQKKIHIERLQIRLPKGFGASSARQIASGLGDEILSQIARNTRQKTGRQRIKNLDAGKIKNSNGTSISDLQKQIARRIAVIIGEKN